MIQPLRTAHRITFVALACSLPLLLAAAITVRKPIAVPVLVRASSPSDKSIADFRFLSNRQRISLSLTRLSGDSRDQYVLRAESGEVSLPETLLYWAPSEATDAVPTGAVLIESIKLGSPLPITEKYTTSGVLLLYDAPHKRILAQSPLGKS